VLRPLAAAAMVGILSAALGRHAVNFVNALHLAKARGVDVRRTSLTPSGDYAEVVELRLSGRDMRLSVVGAMLGESHPRIVRVDDFEMSVAPIGTVVIVRNRDVPGVIGRVGTVIGDAGVNIAEYYQARLDAGGTALAAIRVDGRLSPAVMATLRALPDVLDVRQVELE
jgi:hypothetical protein